MKNTPFKTSEEFLYGQNGGAGRVIDVEAARQEAELPDFSADMGEEERQRKIEAVRKRRLNLARAAAQMVFSKDIDLMDDLSRAGLYRASTKALFGFEDTDGRVAFGKKAGDMKSNLERLRLFLKGDVSQIEDEDVAAWRKLHGADEETRFRHADAHLKGKGSRDWDNGPSAVELAGAGMPGAQFGNFMQNAAAPTKDAATRKMRYETMNDEEKAAFRADTIARYERQIASANPLSMFLKTSAGISDEAAWILAKCYQNGNVDVKDIEAIGDGKEREKVLTALSMMRGDKKSGRLIGFIPQDFEDGTDFGNRLQMNIYGIQQAFAGLVTDVWDLGKAGIDELKIYAKGLKDTEEAREMRRRTDLEAQIAAALRQKLPDADSFMGALSQGVAENVHWIAPYVGPFRVINKGKAALKGVKALKGALALDEIGAAAKGVKAAVKGVAVAKSEAGLARQMAALELYTERLRELSATADAALKAMPEATQALAKTGVAAKARAMIAAGRTAAFSSFANDYIETADAEGISRAESVPSAVFVGVINQAIERFNVPGLDRTITPAELKSLALRSAVEAFRHERGAGLRKWVADSVAIRAREMGRTVATEALTEEPLQQFTTQMALEVDKTIDGLKKEGKADLANVFGELWGKIGADGFGKAWRLYFDTVQESLPAAVGFGVTGVAMQRGGQMWRNSQERKISGDMSYDEGIVDVLQRERSVRKMMAAHWMKDGGKMEEAQNAANEMFSSARAAYKNRKAGDDTVRLVANAAGVDRKTAEVLHDYLEIEESMALYSPRFRAEVNLADVVMDIDEKKLKAVLPEYVEGSFLADKEKGLYSARLNLPNGEEKTLVYRVGDMSQWIDEQIGEGGLADDGELADSYEARRREMPEGAMKPWSELSDAERRDIALQGTDGFLSGRAGVFEFGGADGQKVTVRADDVISLASGRIADVGYVGAQATGKTLRHETFHALWRFAKGTLSKEDIEALYSHFPDLDPAAASDRKLDERMAVEFERYASGNFVPMKVRGVLDRFSGWAMDKLGKLLDAVGVRRDGVTDPVTGKAYTLSDFYDKVLKGELGSGELGVEKRLIAKDGASGSPEPQPKDASSMNAPPGEVTEEELAAVRAKDAERAAAEAETRKAATETEKPVLETEPPVSGTEKPVSGTSEGEIVYTAENPADASVPNARYYKIGLPNSDIKLVGRLEVRDAHAGLTTSTDEDYHDRGNQNRDDKSEESRALVNKIAAHPDPLQIGTVQPIANNGIVWSLPNGDIIIGNHRVNGVRAGYEKGTAGDLEKFVREDAAKRGIEIGEGVNAPLTVFILEKIDAPEGVKADEHEVVRLANESQNRGFNIREQAGNDAKILIDNNLLPRMAFRPDGRIDETKSADAIGKFRQESGAQGMVGEDGMLTEEGQTRLQNAAVAALLAGTGNNALLGRIMDNAGRLDMASQLRALMKVTPELMSLTKTKPQFDIRDALAEALTLYTEWREKDEEKRSEKGKSRHDWRELDKEGKRKRGLSWEAYLSQGDMFRTPSEEAKILGDLFAKTEQLRSFDREDVESAAGKKRVVDLITDYLTDYIENARNVNTETDDMFGGTPASRAEVLAAQRAKGESGARFSMSAPVERSKNLIALHNLKPSDLAAAAELEGMPAPSIAVVKDSMGHDDYGPISFVFGAGVIDPKADRNNKIYSSDAWTPTRGSVNIEYKVLDEKLDEIIASLINAGDENYKKLFKAFSERGSLGDIAENAIAAGEYYRLWHNDAILLSYLNSKGQSVPLSYREQDISHNYSNAVVKGVGDAVGDKIAEIWENGGKTGDEEAVERMSEIMRPAAVKAKDDENPEGAAERRAKGVPTLGERLYGEALKRPWDLAKAVMQYREHGITQEIDTFAVSKTMSEMLSTDDPAYQEWVRSTFAPAVGAKGIRNKRELFTPSGSRRSWEALHDEVTAQRIVDMMYHNSKEVGGNGFGGYNPEGAAVRTYASITEMRRDRDRLKEMPEEEWKKLHDEARKDMIDAVSRLQSKQKGFYSDNSFIELDTIKDIVLQAWIDAKGNKAKYLSICKDELHVYDEETCGDIWDVMMRLRNAPTKYFEAKPERVVGFDEVAFAVVPDDSSAETLEILKNHGIKTHTYKAEDKEDRLRVLNKAADENDTRFSIGGFHGALATGKVGLLREADKMEKGGASREEIWRTTGWWRGKDGKWRVELPDIQMRSKREIELAVKYYGNSISLGELVVAPELFKAYPALEETRIILDNDYFTSSTRGSFDPSTKDITLNGKGQISLANLPYADRSDYDSAIDKVSSDDHLNNWIEISKELGIEVGTFDEEREKAKAKIEEIEKRIVEKNRARLQSLDSAETRSILAHEIQHWIQENEGFAKGGNVKTIREARALNKSLMRDLRKALNKYGFEEWADKFAESDVFVDKVKAAQLKWPGRYFLMEHLFAESLGDEARTNVLQLLDKTEAIYNENAKEAHYGYTESEAYRSLLGEVEARNVQRRLDMSPEERAATPPWETEDVPGNRQIVRFSITRSIAEIDAQDGTNLQGIGELVAEVKNRGEKPRGRQGHYNLSKTPEFLRDILAGEYFTVKTGVILDHFGKDPDHSLTIEDWAKISEALHDPLVIAKYSFVNKAGKRYYPPKSYRIWVEAVINGHWAVVGVEVKSPSRNIDVNAVETVYGDERISLNPEDVVYSRNNEEGIRTLLGGPNSHEYSESPSTTQIISNSLPENNGPSAELLEAMGEKALKSQYGVGSAARNGQGFVDLERGDTFAGIESTMLSKVHEEVENAVLGVTAKIGSNTNAKHLVHKDSSFGDEDPEAHKYAVKNTLELFKKAKTAVVHHDKKGTKNDYIRAFAPFYFRDGIYLATITLRRDKDSDKFYSIEAVETERDAAPGVHNDASKMDSGDSPRSSRRTAQEAQSPESLKTGDSPRSSRRTAQEAQSPVSLEDKISYYLGNVNETEPKFVNSGEKFSQEELIRRIRADISALRNTQFQPARRASMSFAYPNLAWMSNEELLSAAVAAKMALGKSDKVSDRNTTVDEVQRKLRAIHPDWDSSKVALESQRIFGDARKLSKEIRGDIDKGVSDSLILEHLPQSMRTVFGEEMTGEARRGWRLGLFQAKAEAGVKRKVAEAQERLMRDALEIETGMMHGDIERGFGVDLAATLLKVKENEYLKVVPKSSGGEALAASGEVETMGESVAEDAFSADETVEEVKPKVSALVQAIAKRAEAKAEEESAKRKANRERAEKRVGNEDINDGKDAEPDTGDFAGGEISPEEVVEEAVKVGADLNNPLSFALFVMEMARVNWVKKHNLNPDAEPKHSLVYIQFQRKTLQDVYSTLARRVTYSRGRETVMNALQRLDKVTTMRGLIREAEFMGKLVGAKMIRESAQAMCERLDNLLKTEFQTGRQFKPDEESLNRKVPAMLERQARYMRHAMWLTPDGVSEETRALLQEKALAGSEFDEHGADKSVSRVIDEADMKLKILADWGALKYKDLATVEAAVQWWLNAAEGGADAIAQAWDVREARTLKAAGVLAKAVRNPKRKTAVDGKSWTQTANEIFQGHMLFHHLLEDLTRFAGEEERAAAKRYIDWLDLEIQKAGTRVASERIEMQDEMRKAVEQIYGRKFRDVVSELSALDGRFDAFMGAADDGVSVPGTKGRAMQLLVSLQQIGYAVEVEDEENPGQMKTVYMGGYYDNIVENGRVGQAEELLKLMSPADLNFIKWLRQWYERNRKGISDVSERIFGVGVMAELGNYMPVKMLLDPKGLENGAGATWQIFPKALTPRVRNKRDFDTSVDILTMWSGRLEESIQWKHHVELGIELRGIFGRSELQKAIRANHGAKVLSLVKGFITDILNGKGEKQEMMVNPMIDRARQFAALGALGGNVGVMLKQTTSIPAFGFEIGVWRTFRHLVHTLTPQGWADVRKVAQSEEFRNRWQDGYSEEVQHALSSENPGLLMRLWMKSMITNKAGDCVPALLIGHGIYRDGIEQGLSERDAMARTWMIVERTQQSSRIENRTAFQRRNALGNAIYQFLSTQNQMLNYEVRALRDAVADPKNPKKWGKFVRDATLVHFVLSTFYYWMGELYKKLLGQEPSEDQLKDWVVSIIVGPVGALYGVGTTTVDAVESWVKGYSYGSSNAVPALNWLGQVVVRDPTILIHDIFNEKKSWDDVCDDMLRWLSDFNATFRDARKFYRFRIKDEPQKKRK